MPMPPTVASYGMSAKGLKRTSADLFDHLVGAGEHGGRHVDAERLRGLEVDHEFVLGWRLHWQIGRLLAFEDAINIIGREPPFVELIDTVAQQSASLDVILVRVHGPPKADMCSAVAHVCFGPIADITSLDHFVGLGE